MNAECIFCKIVAQEIPAQVIKDSDDILVIQDIAPKAPIHYLILPKKHVETVQSLSDTDRDIAASLLMMAQKLSKDLPGSGSFRLHINSGKEAGQVVPHLHMHFLAGKLKPIDL